jgi:hypothetical protein
MLRKCDCGNERQDEHKVSEIAALVKGWLFLTIWDLRDISHNTS